MEQSGTRPGTRSLEEDSLDASIGRQGPAQPRKWALVGCTALGGAELRPVRDAAVIAGDGRITAVGPRQDVRLPADAEIIDGAGLTVMPGFIDAHVHIGLNAPHDVLIGGVTTVRDLGWPPHDIFPLARASQATAFDGPTIVAAGAMLTAPGGYPARAGWAPRGTGWEVEGPGASQRMVDRLAVEGATVIKVALNPAVGPTLGAGTLQAIVERAHERGLKVTGHVHGLDELEKALAAGVDELAHMLMGTQAIPAPTIEAMVGRNMAVVPTLAIRTGRDLRVGVRNLNRFVRAGGRVVYGTDLGNAGPTPGIDPGEIANMAKAGLTPHEIIASATVASAEWLGLSSTGTLEPGRDADLVAVLGDPLGDAAVLTQVAMVFKRGRRER